MRGIVAILGLWLFVGCMHPTQAVMKDVNPYGWRTTAKIELENGDTSTLRDISLVVRTNRQFRADTIPVAITLLTPDSCHFDEEVAFPMRHRHSPAALRLISELGYRNKVKLNHLGTYTIEITPLRPLSGIEAVGINIIKSPEESEKRD